MTTYGGKCPGCGQGVAIDAPLGKAVACPACGVNVRLAKVTGTYSDKIGCDDRCMYARKADCVCACGGEGHFLGWRVDLTSGRYAQSVPDRIVAKVARSQEQIAARAAKKAEAAEQTVKALQVTYAAGHPAVIAALTNLPADAPPFLLDVKGTLDSKGFLSPRAGEYVLSVYSEWQARLAKIAAQPAPTDVITGKIVVTGEVLSAKFVDGFTYGSHVLKMLVLDDRGFKVFGSMPRALQDSTFTFSTVGGYRGMRVTFTAEVSKSDSDSTFGFFKSPSKAQRLEAIAA